MSYKTPNVVKEIYLPFEGNDDSLTIPQYKEKYGIDLSEIFDVKLGESVNGDTLPYSLKTISKLYLIDIDGLMSEGVYLKNAVYPFSYCKPTGDRKSNLLLTGIDEESYFSFTFINLDGKVCISLSATNL